jgi:hypothetical protein
MGGVCSTHANEKCVLGGESEGMVSLLPLRFTWEDNFRTKIREIGFEIVDICI